jgi:hypothetical protein
MDVLRNILQQAFAIDSVWSVVTRGLVWLGIALVIMVSMDKPDPNESIKDLKTNLGFFLMFIMLTSGLIYLLFGFTAA